MSPAPTSSARGSTGIERSSCRPRKPILYRICDNSLAFAPSEAHTIKGRPSHFGDEIRRITGVAVREAAAEVEPAAGAVVHAFTTGAMVQVFLLAGDIGDERWNRSE